MTQTEILMSYLLHQKDQALPDSRSRFLEDQHQHYETPLQSLGLDQGLKDFLAQESPSLVVREPRVDLQKTESL